jgi:hypothetical protein
MEAPTALDDQHAERRLNELCRSVMPLYRNPATAGTSSSVSVASTPERRAQVERGEAFYLERARLEKRGLSPAEVTARLEDWLAETKDGA